MTLRVIQPVYSHRPARVRREEARAPGVDGEARWTPYHLDARRESLVTLLEARAPLTDAQRARVAACDDEATLAAWFKRAVAGEGAAAILGA